MVFQQRFVFLIKTQKLEYLRLSLAWREKGNLLQETVKPNKASNTKSQNASQVHDFN